MDIIGHLKSYYIIHVDITTQGDMKAAMFASYYR